NYRRLANTGGDANNSPTANGCNGSTENVVVGARSPALSTNAGADVELGATGNNLSDSATLSGATSDASGTITYHLYRGADCSAANEVAGSPVTNTTVAGNGTYVSPTIHVSLAGTYRWAANYGGDANNSATTNGCNGTNENVVVGPRSPALSTNAGADVELGATGNNLSDSATLSGATSDASGTITYPLYRAPSLPAALPISGSPVTNTTVAGNGTYVSPTIHVSLA